jgi:hypothetical protein
MQVRRAAALGVGVLMAVSAVWTHHAFAAEFDVDKPLELRGKVVKDGVDQSTLLDSHRGS